MEREVSFVMSRPLADGALCITREMLSMGKKLGLEDQILSSGGIQPC